MLEMFHNHSKESYEIHALTQHEILGKYLPPARQMANKTPTLKDFVV